MNKNGKDFTTSSYVWCVRVMIYMTITVVLEKVFPLKTVFISVSLAHYIKTLDSYKRH